ncbi:MAG: hypothetical protein LC800_16375 [Acidobacteria bacterium]|nr:hypothetical protein [Acidobacteriota bacterium]
MQRLHVGVAGELLAAVGALKVAAAVGRGRVERERAGGFGGREEGVVVLQLDDRVVVLGAEVCEALDAVAEEVVVEAEVGVELDPEADGRRNLLVNLGDDEARAELGEDGVEDVVVIAVDVEAEDAELARDAVLAEQRGDVPRRDGPRVGRDARQPLVSLRQLARLARVRLEPESDLGL